MRVLVYVTAIVASAVAVPVLDEYSGSPRTVCPSIMTSCECTTVATGVLVSCTNLDRPQLTSTMRDLRGFNVDQFTLTDSKLDIEKGDFADVNLYNMDVDSSKFTIRSLREDFLDNKTSTLRGLRFQNSTVDFGTGLTVPEPTTLSTLWFNFCKFENYREDWFKGLSVDWLRIENCKEIKARVASKLMKLKKYRHINSGLEKLERGMLPDDSTEIEELDFSKNNIISMDRDFLSGLKKLIRLDLSNNKLETLDEETFKDFSGTLILTNNPLKCSDDLKWFAERLRDGKLEQAHRYTCILDGRRRNVLDLLSPNALYELTIEG